jgi:hypothetical protein
LELDCKTLTIYQILFCFGWKFFKKCVLIFIIKKYGWTWWHMPVILALGRLRQEDCKFEASLCHTRRPCLGKANTPSKRHEFKEPVLSANAQKPCEILGTIS